MLFTYKKHIRDGAADREACEGGKCADHGVTSEPPTDVVDETEDDSAEVISPFKFARQDENTK